MSWTTLHLQVSTPLFNGGADQKRDAGVRVSSVRGAMRFWFRALAGIGIGARHQDLLRLERHVFGGIRPGDETGAADGRVVASPVKLRVAHRPPVMPPGMPDWCDNSEGLGQWVVYLMGQGLGGSVRRDGGGRTGRRGYDCTVSRPYVAAGETLDIQLRFGGDGERAALVLASLWLLCTYGGVGARVRRGFGGLRIIGVDGELPEPWTADTIRTPDLSFYEQRYTGAAATLWLPETVGRLVRTLRSVATHRDVDVEFDVGAAPAGGLPTYPVFSKRHTRVGLSGGEVFGDWPDVLAHAGEQMRWFRATIDNTNPQASYRPKIETPEWKHTIHDADTRFGLGALGLPVGFKESYQVHADKGPRRDDRLRRASPLWLRPVGGDGGWRLLSYAFHGDFLPDDVDVHLWKGDRRGKELTVTDRDVVDRTTKWIDKLRVDGSFVRHG